MTTASFALACFEQVRASLVALETELPEKILEPKVLNNVSHSSKVMKTLICFEKFLALILVFS